MESQSTEPANLANVIPEELRNLCQWVNWKRESGENGLKTKVPYCTSGFRASTKNPEHWRPFIVPYLARKKFDGIGFILAESDGYVGIDLDGCIDERGKVASWAVEIIDKLKSVAYGELSPSGRGIKFITKAKKPTNKCLYKIPGSVGKEQIECYEKRRFWTMTGNVYGDDFRQIGDGQAAINWLSKKYLKSANPKDRQPTSSLTRNGYVDHSAIIIRASKYLAKMEPAIAGQAGSVACLKAALAMVKGFSLSKGETFDLLVAEYNPRCVPPWSEQELLHKIESASQSIEVPDGYLLEPPASSVMDAVGISTSKQSTLCNPIEAEDDPHRLARINLECYEKGFSGRLVFWRDEWWKYKCGCYRKISASELRAKVTGAIRKEFERCWYDRLKQGGEDAKKPVRKVQRPLVTNTIGAMESICSIPSSAPMPCWLPDRSQRHYLTVNNGILDLEAVFRDDGSEILKPHTSDWFSPFKLDYSFDLDATCPKWESFIEFAMEHDLERMAILQEWAGYLLTNVNTYQRFLALEGEGGNGKTVYFAGMTAMLGQHNVSHVALEKFSGQFDLATTIGKAANICGDVGEIDTVAEAEIKQFTGGDVMQFDRKRIDPISIRPTAKLMISFNRRPKFKDRSDGLWRRMILIPFNRKPAEKEIVRGMDTSNWWIDQGETSGILLWAIAGLRRLREQGGFTKSRISADAIEDYRMTANPALEFLKEFVTEEAGARLPKNHMYKLYVHYCKESGHKFPLSQRAFGREVNKNFPSVIDAKIDIGQGRENAYSGIAFAVQSIFGMDAEGSKVL